MGGGAWGSPGGPTLQRAPSKAAPQSLEFAEVETLPLQGFLELRSQVRGE